MKHVNEKYKNSELTSRIIGCAMEVHKILGNGFQEVIYQRVLALELNLKGIGFQREDVHLAQAINYLEVYNLEVGLLINFGSKSLDFKRLMNKKFQSPSQNHNNQSLRQ